MEFKPQPEKGKGTSDNKAPKTTENSVKVEKVNVVEVVTNLRKKLKEIKDEAQIIYTLTLDEEDADLSKLISQDLHICSINLFRGRLQASLGKADNWTEPETREFSVLKREKPENSQMSIPLDKSDMFASETTPLFTFSKRLMKKSNEILKLCITLSESKQKDIIPLSFINSVANEIYALYQELR